MWSIERKLKIRNIYLDKANENEYDGIESIDVIEWLLK